MSDSFLTADELEDLTGLVQPAAQVRWLLKNDVHHYVRADGRVRVPRKAIDEPGTHLERPSQPNFGALRAPR